MRSYLEFLNKTNIIQKNAFYIFIDWLWNYDSTNLLECSYGTLSMDW